MQDTNLVILAGRVLTHEVRSFDTGSQVVRYTVSVRVEEPRPRLDVIQVNLWVREDDEEPYLPDRGERVLVVGAVQRRFWQAPDGRRSRMEVIADDVTPMGEERATLRLVELGAKLTNGGEEE
jgi:single-stranded DNA-binding protein